MTFAYLIIYLSIYYLSIICVCLSISVQQLRVI